MKSNILKLREKFRNSIDKLNKKTDFLLPVKAEESLTIVRLCQNCYRYKNQYAFTIKKQVCDNCINEKSQKHKEYNKLLTEYIMTGNYRMPHIFVTDSAMFKRAKRKEIKFANKIINKNYTNKYLKRKLMKQNYIRKANIKIDEIPVILIELERERQKLIKQIDIRTNCK